MTMQPPISILEIVMFSPIRGETEEEAYDDVPGAAVFGWIHSRIVVCSSSFSLPSIPSLFVLFRFLLFFLT